MSFGASSNDHRRSSSGIPVPTSRPTIKALAIRPPPPPSGKPPERNRNFSRLDVSVPVSVPRDNKDDGGCWVLGMDATKQDAIMRSETTGLG